MLQNFIANRILAQLPFEPNEGQRMAIDQLCQFLISRDERPCFILRGYAGTGKTSLVGALVRALGGMEIPCVLLAPTGRAAKVMGRYSGFPAYTIHRAIYRQQSSLTPSFSLAPNMLRNAVFIIDEASMLSADRDNPLFGSGSLLDDLIQHVYSGLNCRMILVGDDAQLPPVGHTSSPALQAGFMAGYGLSTTEAVLTTVARQAAESGILNNATLVRSSNPDMQFAPDFIRLEPQDVMQQIEASYRDVGEEETLILTRSNYRVKLFNQGIRARILYREELLEPGDRVMVTKNSYGVAPSKNHENDDDNEFIANGEMFKIKRLRNEREIYGFTFIDAELDSIDRAFEITRTLWIDTLKTDTPEENMALQKTLFERIAEDYPEIHNQRELTKKVRQSPYYNALQVKHAYAVTCHKAQGGQWKHIYIDVPVEEREDHLRWVYTAITRATERVFWIK